MLRSSLSLRLIIGIILTLIVFIPVASISIEQAFRSSLESSLKQRLQSQLYFLIAELEFEENNLFMPDLVADETLNQLNSGTYAYIFSRQLLLWSSRSSSILAEPQQLPESTAGIEEWSLLELDSKHYYRLSLTVLFDVYQQEQPFTVHLLFDKEILEQDVASFRETLWQWLIVIAVILLVLQLVWLAQALLPLRKMGKQIDAIERGKQSQISGKYPLELEQITQSINKLISTEQQQRSRYKNSLSDLTHALKTPLAILKGQSLDVEGEQQIEQINKMIERQLKKAASGVQASWHLGIEVSPLAEKTTHAMAKIYQDKNLSISSEIAANATFYGDESDLFELLGNLLDNACKAAEKSVRVIALSEKDNLTLVIEDDGPGIPQSKRDSLLVRGKRLDTYQQGHGVGLAIVSDLVASYQGTIEIGDSELGGAKFILSFIRS